MEKIEEEQKPVEWSEEDEKELDCIINILDRLGFEEYRKSSRDQDVEEERFYYKEIQFLKRLKSLSPKPHTVSITDATKFGNLEYERGVKDGIQSEKNRHWKPSEEQMEALSETIAFAPDTFKPKCTLVTLQDDLKKQLMEE
jgi:hypothetical protein